MSQNNNHDKSENEIIAVFSEYDRLIEEINELRAEIVRLTALRDDLVLHICPKLRAQYEEEIWCIEREIFAAKMYLREKQMILENLRAQLNRQEIVSYEKAAKKAGEEREQFEEELKRKTKEAEENKEKWHKTAWSSFTGGDEEDISKEWLIRKATGKNCEQSWMNLTNLRDIFRWSAMA